MQHRTLGIGRLVAFPRRDLKAASLVLLGAMAILGAPYALAASPSLAELQTLVASADFGTIGRKLSTLITLASARELQAASVTSSGSSKKSRRALKKAIHILTKADRLLASRRGARVVDPALRNQARALIAAALADLRARGGGTAGGQGCRTYATAFTTVTTQNGEPSATETGDCAFSTSTHQLTCHRMSTDTDGCVSNRVVVSEYNSTADFVDEVASIPPFRILLTKLTDTTAQSVSCSGSSVSMIVYSYDSQRRLTQLVGSPSGITFTYSAWDTAGRRLMGTITGAGSPGTTEAWSYDDAARTATLVDTTDIPEVGPFVTTTVQTYDANGNIVKVVGTAPGPSVVVMDTTTSATQQVCK